MAFQIDSQRRSFPTKPDATVWRLHDPDTGCDAEIAIDFGCNCYRWFINQGGQPLELLYHDREVFPGGRPTRSGIPVLFPFPNRIRDGRFTWEDQTYQLPLNDASGKHAIHGFACRHAWTVQNTGSDADAAWLSADFHASRDAPEAVQYWPADHRLRLTWRLQRDRLRLEVSVDNPDRVSLPFGLGFHPYFALANPDVDVFVPARCCWPLIDHLPPGVPVPVDVARDLSVPRPARGLTLDDILTDLAHEPVNAEGLVLRGRCGRVELWTSPAFRELVVFTPTHRQAVCLEPYTCTTDAVNLQQRGIDAGWLALAPGASWTGVVEVVVRAV